MSKLKKEDVKAIEAAIPSKNYLKDQVKVLLEALKPNGCIEKNAKIKQLEGTNWMKQMEVRRHEVGEFLSYSSCTCKNKISCKRKKKNKVPESEITF